MTQLSDYVNGIPNLSGAKWPLIKPGNHQQIFLPESGIDWDNVKSAFAIALHMHQPIIPNPDQPLKEAEEISYLKHMMDHPDVGDNHNASVFRKCYKRMGDYIPELLDNGRQPRVMFDYSGTLLHGMRKMGLDDVFDNLKKITCDPKYRHCVEWLGSAWGHPVAPSTPIQDYRLHVNAWLQFFASIFGTEAVSRIRGFSPAEMALPNHPDVFYEFVKTLKDAGFRWLIVQEHTVEFEDGGGLQYKHRPHKLIARNSKGEKLSITAIIKTQGSDTKLIGQMQPYYEAKGLGRIELDGKSVPSLVTQISDGENGGVMMNEFPGKYHDVINESSGTQTPAVNVTEYLEYLDSMGVNEDNFPAIQPIMQHLIWEKFEDGAGPERLEEVIKKLEKENGRFHMEGGSWTNNISWVRGYDKILKPMEQASADFNQKVLEKGVEPSEQRYRNALYHLLLTQTSCYRYWGQGQWVDFGRELCRRTEEILKHDFS
jgi:hypothetical protein